MGVSAQTALQVTFSVDRMEAILQSQISLEGRAMAPEEIQELLREAGVCTGIMDDVVSRIARDGLDSHGVVVARGIQPRAGVPGRVEPVYFPPNHQSKMPTVLSVRKGDVLAVLHPPSAGMPGMTVTVRTVTEDGRPLEVLFRFPVALEDRSLHWVCWEAGRFRAFRPPGIGASIELPPSGLPF